MLTYVLPAAKNPSDGSDQLVGSCFFGNKTGSSSFQHSHRKLIFGVHAQHQYMDLLFVLFYQGQGIPGVGSLSHLEVGLSLQYLLQAAPDNWVIIDDEHVSHLTHSRPLL